jgi:phytoene synthase
LRTQITVSDFYTHCEALVRVADRDRYLAALFAPAAARRHLCALYAFAAEIARVPERAHQPLAGEIRLQWWRDVLGGDARGGVAGHPVAAALLDTIAACGLPNEPLMALIDAHAFDLYDEAMPSLADLDAYLEHTEGTLFTLGARILAAPAAADDAGRIAAAAIPAGIAYGMARLLHTPRQRHIVMPLDLAAQHGITRGEIDARRDTAALRAALAALRDHARAAFERFRAAARAVPQDCAPAFLVAAVVPPWLARFNAAANPLVPVEVAPWRRQWALWRAARRWPMV